MSKAKIIVGAIFCFVLMLLGCFLSLFVWVAATARAADKLCNRVYFDGDQDETISSHAGRYAVAGKEMPWRLRTAYVLANWIEPNHCEKHIIERFKDMPFGTA